MSDILKVTSVPQVRDSLAVSHVGPVSNTQPLEGQKSGNDLPPNQKAASLRHITPEKPQDFQEEIKVAVSQMNEYVEATQRDLSFRYDAERGETVVQVLDRNTQEVIRQIPDAIFLKIAQQLAEEAPGALLSAQV